MRRSPNMLYIPRDIRKSIRFHSSVDRFVENGCVDRHTQCDGTKTGAVCSGSVVRTAGEEANPPARGTVFAVCGTRTRGNAAHDPALRHRVSTGNDQVP